MDEQRKQKLVEIVKKMNLDRVPTAEIRNNLKEMGVITYDIDEIIRMVSLQPTPSEIHESVLDVKKKIDAGGHLEPAMKQLQDHKDIVQRTENKVQEMHGDLTETKDNLEDVVKTLQKHKEKLEDVHTTVQDLTDKHQEVHEKIDEMDVKKDLEEIKNEMVEIKSLLGVIKELNEKLLKANKEILLKK
jgi:methyl-accepting chemotaxis protein